MLVLTVHKNIIGGEVLYIMMRPRKGLIVIGEHLLMTSPTTIEDPSTLSRGDGVELGNPTACIVIWKQSRLAEVGRVYTVPKKVLTEWTR